MRNRRMKFNAALTCERARTLFSYDKMTGLLTRKIRTGNTVKAGEEPGWLTPEGYRQVGVDGKHYLVHRVIWLMVYGEWPTGFIDHIDQCHTNNRLQNFRPATKSQNMCNRGKTVANTSGFKGVSWGKSNNAWQACICIHYKGDDPLLDELPRIGRFGMVAKITGGVPWQRSLLNIRCRQPRQPLRYWAAAGSPTPCLRITQVACRRQTAKTRHRPQNRPCRPTNSFFGSASLSLALDCMS